MNIHPLAIIPLLISILFGHSYKPIVITGKILDSNSDNVNTFEIIEKSRLIRNYDYLFQEDLHHLNKITYILVKRVIDEGNTNPSFESLAGLKQDFNSIISVLNISRAKTSYDDYQSCSLIPNDTCIFSLVPINITRRIGPTLYNATFLTPLLGTGFKISLSKISELSPRVKRDTGPDLESLTIVTPSYPTPCESKACPFGSLCTEIWNSTKLSTTPKSDNTKFRRHLLNGTPEAICLCPSTTKACSPNKLDPVCGTDQVTYLNECYLRQTACQFRLHIYPFPNALPPAARVRLKHPASSSQVLTSVIHPFLWNEQFIHNKQDGKRDNQIAKSPDRGSPCSDKSCKFGSVCVSVALPLNVSHHSVHDTTHLKNSTVDLASGSLSFTACSCPDDAHHITKSRCDISFGDDDFTGLPVCGTDGVDYGNLCQLRATSCKLQNDISVKHVGKCDPCKDVHCDHVSGQVCKVIYQNSSGNGGTLVRKPLCTCHNDCPSTRNLLGSKTIGTGIAFSPPLCGTNGKFYENVCFLKVEACLSGDSNLTVHSYDPRVCGEPKYNPCSSGEIICPPYTSCRSSPHNLGHYSCQCPFTCPPVYTPVCGTDDKTYDSQCHLEKSACLNNSATFEHKKYVANSSLDMQASLSVDYNGLCRFKEALINHELNITTLNYKLIFCSGNEDCVSVINQHATCIMASSLTDEYVGKSYDIIRIIHKTGRSLCACSDCPYYDINGDGIDRVVNGFDPVCGSNGVTYYNECHLLRESCLILLVNKRSATSREEGIHMLSRGLCPMKCVTDDNCDFYGTCRFENGNKTIGDCGCEFACLKTSDQSPDSSKVCGTDGLTYVSECAMKEYSCRAKQFTVVAHKGSCQEFCSRDGDQVTKACTFEGICINGICQCPTCHSNLQTFHTASNSKITNISDYEVCGSDGITYADLCTFRKRICETKVIIKPMHNGSCEDYPNSEPYKIPELQDDDKPNTGLDNRYRVSRHSAITGIDLRLEGEEIGEDCDERLNCRYGGKCIYIEMPSQPNRTICHCPNCDYEVSFQLQFVCGTDGNLYENACHLRRESCLFQTHLKISPDFEACTLTLPIMAAMSCDTKDGGSNTVSESIPPPNFQRTSRPIDISNVERCCFAFSPITQKVIFKTCAQYGISDCECNHFGSTFPFCHGSTGRCLCKAHVTGRRCDKCASGFWGLHRKFNRWKRERRMGVLKRNVERIHTFVEGVRGKLNSVSYGTHADQEHDLLPMILPFLSRLEFEHEILVTKDLIQIGQEGCLPCRCSQIGSRRQDCEQLTGRCMCKAGIIGPKCDLCSYAPFSNHGLKNELSPDTTSKNGIGYHDNSPRYPGCRKGEDNTRYYTSCSQLECQNFAVCVIDLPTSRTFCDCDPLKICDADISHPYLYHQYRMSNEDVKNYKYSGDFSPKERSLVCGSDGKTYGSLCQLKLISCGYQIDIKLRHIGPCILNLYK